MTDGCQVAGAVVVTDRVVVDNCVLGDADVYVVLLREPYCIIW
jgi:hypothetical protein